MNINHYFIPDIFNIVTNYFVENQYENLNCLSLTDENKTTLLNFLSTCKICRKNEDIFFKNNYINFRRLENSYFAASFNKKIKGYMRDFLNKIRIIGNLKSLDTLETMHNVTKLGLDFDYYEKSIVIPDRITHLTAITNFTYENMTIPKKLSYLYTSVDKLKELIKSNENCYIENMKIVNDGKYTRNSSLVSYGFNKNYFGNWKIINLEFNITVKNIDGLPKSLESLFIHHFRNELILEIPNLHILTIGRVFSIHKLPENLKYLTINSPTLIRYLPQSLISLELLFSRFNDGVYGFSDDNKPLVNLKYLKTTEENYKMMLELKLINKNVKWVKV